MGDKTIICIECCKSRLSVTAPSRSIQCRQLKHIESMPKRIKDITNHVKGDKTIICIEFCKSRLSVTAHSPNLRAISNICNVSQIYFSFDANLKR